MPRTMPGVTHFGPWLCLGILLLLFALPVRAATQGGEALYIHKWMPLPSPLLDNSVTVDTRFQITSDVESDDYRLMLAGLNNSLEEPPELALVYEHVLGGGFWPKARLLLAAPVTSIIS